MYRFIIHSNVKILTVLEKNNQNIKLSFIQQFYVKIIKTFLDYFFSIILLPLLLLLSIIIKVIYLIKKDKESIFFKQDRIGKDGKEFSIIKFRTMSADAEEKLKDLLKDTDNSKEWEMYHKLKNDPRITDFGLFLRKSSIDEFPQFINVLKGDMSIIGPRPLVKGELENHNGSKIYWKVKPGISGWWACNGRSNISYSERLGMEYYYVNNISLLFDIKIAFRTIACVIKKTGAQ